MIRRKQALIMSKLYIPQGGYHSVLDLQQTETAIKETKDFFEQHLSSELRLRRVTAPLFVLHGTGINDDLNSIERPVKFPLKDMNDATAEVVHSLAKWKRMMLAKYGIPAGQGLYTDMNAIRPDDEFDNIHSVYVDQWDWEKTITDGDRTLDYLKKTVEKIAHTPGTAVKEKEVAATSVFTTKLTNKSRHTNATNGLITHSFPTCSLCIGNVGHKKQK